MSPRMNIAFLAFLLTVSYRGTMSESIVDVHPEDSAIVSATETENLATVVCLQPDLDFFCGLINLAKSDPVVAKLFDPATLAIVFAPTTRGINHTRALTLRWMGATLAQVASSPTLASKFVRSNLMMDSAPDFRTWRNGQIFYNALVPQQALTVVEGQGRNVAPGTTRAFFLSGPVNIVRAGFQSRYNLIGGTGGGFVTVIEDPIMPPISSA